MCIINAPAHIVGILVADSISWTGLSVPHGHSLQSHKTFFSTEILRVIGWVGSWHTFLAFPLALLCSFWLCWRWYRVHFRITAQLEGLWQSSGVNKENYEPFEILTEEWLMRKRISSCKSLYQSRTKAAAVVCALTFKRVCVYVFLRICVCLHPDMCLQVLHQIEGEMKSFSQCHPIHDTSNCELGINTAAHSLSRGVIFSDRCPLIVINTKWSTLSESCYHIFLSEFLRDQSPASSDCWHTPQHM